MAAELTVNWTGKAPVRTARELGKIAASGTHVNIRINYGRPDLAAISSVLDEIKNPRKWRNNPWGARRLAWEAAPPLDAGRIDPHFLPWLRSLVAEGVSVAA